MSEPLLNKVQTASKSFRFWPLQSFNHNMGVSVVHSILEGVAWSTWADTVLSVVIYQVTGGSNFLVGVVDGAAGIVSVAVSLPIGWVADRWPRRKARLVAIGGVLTPIAVVATAVSVIGAVDSSAAPTFGTYNLLLGAMCVWGLVSSIADGPAQALLADSTPQGDRCRLFTITFVAGTLASAVGPLITVGLFLYQGGGTGGVWRLDTLRDVVLFGLALELLSGGCLFWYRDSAAIEQAVNRDKTRGGDVVNDNGGGGTNAGSDDSAGAGAEVCADCSTDANCGADDSSGGHADGSNGGGNADEEERREEAVQAWAAALPRVWLVPYILFTSSLLVCLGSGATIKFFPLFFKSTCHMGPIAVQLMAAAAPLIMALFSTIVERLANRFGRVPVMTFTEALGVACLALLATIAERGVSTPVIIGVYLLRTGLMNCTYPLEDSVLMDFVPPATRARWQSLDSVSSATWAGSAALGGLLADRYGYTSTFLITAALQGLAVLTRATLLFIVPRHERPPAGSEDQHSGACRGEGQAPALVCINAQLRPAESPSRPGQESCDLGCEERWGED